jgi:hypothetical protein
VAAACTPEDVAKVKEGCTGAYLKGLLGRRAGAGRAGGAQEKSKREAAE